MGSSKKQTVGYRYYLGAHMYLGHAEFDKIYKIRVSDKTVWEGEAMDETIYINSPKAFGGTEREGGIQGYVDVESGSNTQAVNTYLNSKQDSINTVPAYRGKTALVLNQVYMGTNPYMKPWSVYSQRIYKTDLGADQWYRAKAGILNPAIINYSIDFTGTVSDYTVIEGSSANFTDVSSPYGNAIRAYDNGAPRDIIQRSFTPISVISLQFYFRVTLLDNDDAGRIFFYDSSDTLIFTLVSAREDVVDSLRRVQVNATVGESGEYLSTAAPDVDKWYRVDASFTGGTAYVSLYDTTDDSLVGSAEVACPANPEFAYFQIWTEGDLSGTGGVTEWAGININNIGQTLDMNPAHIIRECLTHTVWGLGYAASDIDDTAFTAAADTLYSESFGLSFYWQNSESIYEFIRNVLRHIDGALYVSPSTGKWVLTLIRDDYTLGSLATLDESNIIEIQDYKKPTINELVNHVTVNYWDSSTGQDASISVQDIALAQQQGQVIANSVTYDGCTKGELAEKLASRDLAALSNPLATCVIIANREAYNLNIGDAFKLTWPKYGLSEVVFRVSNIGFGTLNNGQIRIECLQDVFAFPTAIYGAPESSGWTAPVNDPVDVTNWFVQETPYWLLIQDQGEDFTLDTTDGYLMVGAAQPTSDSISYRIWTDESGDYVEQEAADFCPYATLDHDFPKANNGTIETAFSVTGLTADEIDDIAAGSACRIGTEWMVIVSVTSTGTDTADVVVGRAVADTVIADHLSGAGVYFFSDYYGSSTTLYQDAESVNVKLTPQTGNGFLDVASATAMSLTFDQRAYRAYPPANIKLNTVYFPDAYEDTGSVDSTWAHRDRLTQTAGLVDFDEASIGPEASTTYTTTLTRVNTGAVLDTNTGLTGTSDSLDPGGYDGLVLYEIKAVRDSLDSYFSQSHQFVVSRTTALHEESFGDFLYTEDLEVLMTES